MKYKFITNLSISKATVIVVSVYILLFHFTLPKYTFDHYSREVSWDILSYYLYLPLSFIEHDIGLSNSSYSTLLIDKYQLSTSFYQAAPAPNGNLVMIYTMGMALLYLPFFLIGHVWATFGGYPTDGFSFPYQFSVATGMMLYVVLGVLFLRKLLLYFFSEKITSIVIILITLGTNYFREATDYNMGPHVTLFFLYSVLLYYIIKWHEIQKAKYAVIIGLSIGMLILIRPTEAICVFIPIFWDIYNKESLKRKIQLLKKNYHQLLYLFICVVIVGLPQMIYWKYQTGSFIYNSYWN
ncbi:MAG: hypothetical protein L6Q66_03360, partial [Bacteroidia bacterium]|nr:hypothetical protein [Bacteroidia bacterium]